MTTTIPSTTKFPLRVSDLDRAALEAAYFDIRGHYKSLMLSRGKFRSSSIKNRAAMDVLEERLRTIAEREASVRAEAYEMLEIVTNVIGELEDAGDDLVTEFKAYQEGKKTFQGGSFIGRLIKAVIRFITRWTRSKEDLQKLIDKQESMKKQLESGDGTDS
tara:strand:- start:58 stop:540 length:483 start_codon:yes stop_codon:yes gene_type:complete